MAHIPEENIELVRRFAAFAVAMVARQKAAEIALSKFGLSAEQWQTSLAEAYARLAPVSVPENQPLEGYLRQLEEILRTP
jgi:hypothetical protein